LTAARIPAVAAVLANLAWGVACVAARIPTQGHPPLSDYVAAAAVPLAWILAALGLASAAFARSDTNERRRRLAIAANVVAILAAGAVWLCWPMLRATS